MRQMYIDSWSDLKIAGHSGYVFSERVRTGEVLHVQNCYAHAPNRAASAIIQIGIRNGSKDVLIRARGGAIAKEGMSSLNDFFLGEGDQVFAYFPDAAEDDTIELHVIGVLYDLKSWRTFGE